MCYREESKPDSDLDEPWIMTVKGNNFNNKQGAAIMGGDEAILSTSPYKHNGSSNSLTRDSNLNHYKVNQVSSKPIKRRRHRPELQQNQIDPPFRLFINFLII